MIVMEMRDDHVRHGRWINAKSLEALARAAQKRSSSPFANLPGEPQIDDKRHIRRADEPYEVIHVDQCFMGVCSDKNLGRWATLQLSILDRINFVLRQACLVFQ